MECVPTTVDLQIVSYVLLICKRVFCNDMSVFLSVTLYNLCFVFSTIVSVVHEFPLLFCTKFSAQIIRVWRLAQYSSGIRRNGMIAIEN